MICVELAKDWFEELIRESGHYDHQVHFFSLHTILINPNWYIRKLKKTNIITRIYCPELICLWKKKKKQSSKVSNFMRTVGNMGSAVDYRVITILDA